MRLAGFLLLPAGCFIVLAAVVLLPFSPSQTVFGLSGMGVEILGLTLVVRSYMIARGDSG